MKDFLLPSIDNRIFLTLPLVKDMITSAIEQSAANTTLASEALKQASTEVAQVQTLISQVQSQLQTQASLSEE
ncbi:hypothetical protein [Neobacillus muris]|uniref:hypothetical protein n=1 Tax=Neobacillus muris TaxID=2941334 RepID=UPI002040D788|nr:hypothetical protein [Neobacillus muris]